ncbi:MAG: hypothetical protein ACI8UR_001078 [Natronomonas sp.]|jgi:hypothetical protein|uniref:hypothetical protein n=1 Tax=Natronomonas sp. TaxID=2184060 RepID=UPI003989494A
MTDADADAGGDANADEIRGVLLDHSDHQAVRNVFGAYTGSGTATLADYIEAMRATDGTLALVANDGAAEVYARWDGHGARYEHLTMWPPWSIGGYDHKDSSALAAYLDEKDDLRPTLHEYTPFDDQQVLSSLSHRIWP